MKIGSRRFSWVDIINSLTSGFMSFHQSANAITITSPGNMLYNTLRLLPSEINRVC